MHLLDTDVLSELRKPARVGNAVVRKWVSEQDADDFFLSVVSVLEVAIGMRRRGGVKISLLRLSGRDRHWPLSGHHDPR